MCLAADDMANDVRTMYVIRRQFPAKSLTTTSSAAIFHPPLNFRVKEQKTPLLKIDRSAVISYK